MGRYKLNGDDIAGFSRDSKDILFDKTGTSYSSDDVDGVLREIDGKINYKTPDYIAENTNNFSIAALLNSIRLYIDFSKVTPFSCVKYDDIIYRLIKTDNATYIAFESSFLTSNNEMCWRYFRAQSNANYAAESKNGSVPTDISSQRDGKSMYFYY